MKAVLTSTISNGNAFHAFYKSETCTEKELSNANVNMLCDVLEKENLPVMPIFVTTNLTQKDLDKISFVINQLKKTKTSDGKIFCQSMQALDLLRKENFAETHAEIAKAMGYVLN